MKTGDLFPPNKIKLTGIHNFDFQICVMSCLILLNASANVTLAITQYMDKLCKSSLKTSTMVDNGLKRKSQE
jgi:hypothetical protein